MINWLCTSFKKVLIHRISLYPPFPSIFSCISLVIKIAIYIYMEKKPQNFELNTSISIPNFDTHLYIVICLVTKLLWDKLLNIGNKSQKSIMQLSGCNICTTKRLEQQLNNIRKAERGTPLYHLNPGHSSRFNSSCPTYDFNVQSCDAIKQDHLYFLLPYYEPNRICCGKFLSIFVTLQNSQK